MANSGFGTKVLQGKYQITKNTYVVCYLHVLEANDQALRTFLSLKKGSYTQVPIGTKIFFNAEPMNKQKSGPDHQFDIFSITVKQIEDMDGQPLHVCTTIQKSSRPDMRSQPRKNVDFPVQLTNSSSVFIAKNGNNRGLTLRYTANRAMVSLILNRSYNFSVHLKGEDYILPGKIKHIQYDWKSHQHIIGVDFSELTKDQDIILNLLVDPDYTVQLSDKQTVDTASGKISLDE